MKTTTDYKFDVSISEKAYDHKPNKDTEVHLIKFTKKTVDVTGFLEYMLEGYCYAPIFSKDSFGMKGDRSNGTFRYSYIVSIDVDHSLETMNEMVDRLEYKPTCSYTTCQNGLNGESRFRLVYCFENKIEKLDEYRGLVDAIFDANKLDYNEIVNGERKYDSQTRVPSQIYFGNGTDSFDFTVSDIIYNIKDFNIYYNINNNIDNNILNNSSNSNKEKSVNENYIYTPTNNIHLNDTFWDKQFEDDFNRLKIEEIIAKYVNVYPNLEHTPLEIPDDDTPYILYPDGYIEINRLCKVGKDKRYVRVKDCGTLKIKDGEGRRKTLFWNGIIRRLINPNITYDNLVYNLLYELCYYITNYNAENIIGKKEIAMIARDVMKQDMSKYEYLRNRPVKGKKEPKKFITNPKYCIKHNTTKNKIKGTAGKLVRHKEYAELYDSSKTIKENVEYMKSHGVKVVSDSTLKRWRDENGLSKKRGGDKK